MFLALLQQSKTISNVIFAASYSANDEWQAPCVFINTSGSLKTLRLKRDAYRLLPEICLPGLESLWIDTLKKNATRPARDALSFVVDFLDRSNPPLETFTLGSSADVISDMLPSTVLSMPHLKCLNLYIDIAEEHGYLTSVFDALARNDNGAFDILPKLKILHIYIFARANRNAAALVINEVDRDHFVEMVRARTAYPASPLRLVQVIVSKGKNGYCNLDESDLGVLREYERRVDGLKISIQDARLRDVSPSL
ncbi:hypothetical protein CPB85DRAFT_1442237 [Mucidula mucida]|nr:hypothetical protein CPB85DRAFT_1442237 [Mucidula mucida]